jgi:biopolymer transport protein ExbB
MDRSNKTMTTILLVLFMFFIFSAVVASVYAAPAGGGEEVVKESKSWLDLFKSTGFVGIILVCCSIAGTALTIRFFVEIKEEKLMPIQMVQEVEDLLAAQDIDQARELCRGNNNYFCNIMTGALERSFGGYEEVRAGLAETSTTETFKLNARISYLSLLGGLGPLIGLLGTVTGMITSFQTIETMKAPTPGDLAKGVYESLVNTTMGLFAAIIFLTIYFILKNKLSGLTLKINTIATDIIARTISPEAQKAFSESNQN